MSLMDEAITFVVGMVVGAVLTWLGLVIRETTR